MNTIQTISPNVASAIPAQTEQAAQSPSSTSQSTPLLSGNSVTIVSADTLNGLMGGDIQMLFAKLQTKLAEENRAAAMAKIEEIQKSQEERKNIATFIAEARNTLEQDAGNPEDLDAKMKALLQKHQIECDTGDPDSCRTKGEWESTIVALTDRMDKIGSDTQQAMAELQDFMGQYNSYQQEASSKIGNSMEMLSNLTRPSGQAQQNSEMLETIEENRTIIA